MSQRFYPLPCIFVTAATTLHDQHIVACTVAITILMMLGICPNNGASASASVSNVIIS
jgi:hypothetical protein